MRSPRMRWSDRCSSHAAPSLALAHHLPGVPKLFLPFTPEGKRTELAAIAVKRHLGLPPDAAVDPFAVLPDVPARLVDVSLLDSALLTDQVEGWSGIGFGCDPFGEELIALNPTHAETRQRATLMEEIVHIVLDHPKTKLTVSTAAVSGHPISTIGLHGALPSRTVTRASARTFTASVEDDAYNIGAACVVPYRPLFDAVHVRHEHITTIAARYQVSTELIIYRIKRAGLSRVYNKHHCSGLR